MNDEYDVANDKRRDEYRWFIDSCYDKTGMMEQLLEVDPMGKLDDNFEEFRKGGG